MDTDTPTLAGAALAAGRPVLARSFRFHRPRGAFCHAGWCQQCKVRLADGRTVLACRTGAEELSALRAPPAWLRPVGLLAERLPPWFHEAHLPKPQWLRQVYLNLIRRLSGALPLPAAPAGIAEKPWREERCGTLVIGGGLAGMAAAESLRAAGRDVLLVEAERLGGAARFQPAMAGVVAEARAALAASGARVLEGTTALGLYDDATLALVAAADGMLLLRFEALVVATGAYDRLPAVAGNDRPGIVGVRAFERLMRAGSIPPGSRVGLYAAGAEAERALDAAGGRPFAFTAGPTQAGGMTRARLLRVVGRGCVRAVELDPGGRIACDLLVVGFSQPGYEFQLQAGAVPALASDGSLRPAAGGPRLLAVGEAAGARSPVDAAAQARDAVRCWLAGEPAAAPPPDTGEAPPPADGAAMICPCEDVRVGDVRRALADGYRDIDLIKRRTGAGTGPCQGKLCHAELLRCLSEARADVRLPTVRPLVRPTTLGSFLGGSDV